MKHLLKLLVFATVLAALQPVTQAQAQTPCNAMAAFRTWYSQRFNLVGYGTLNHCTESWHTNTNVDVACTMFSDLGLFTAWNFEIKEVGPVNPQSHSFQALHAHSQSNYEACRVAKRSGQPMSPWWWYPPNDMGGVYCYCSGPTGTAQCVTTQYFWQNPH